MFVLLLPFCEAGGPLVQGGLWSGLGVGIAVVCEGLRVVGGLLGIIIGAGGGTGV